MAQILIDNEKLFKESVEELSHACRLSHDTETFGPDDEPDVSGLFPFHGARSFSHIFATKEDEFYFNFNKNQGGLPWKFKSKLQPIFNNPEKIIFYVNAIFDGTISYFDGLTFNQRITDCPSLARVEYNLHNPGNYNTDESFLSLEYLANYYGVKQKDDRVKAYIKEHDLYSPEKCRFTGKSIPLYNKVPIELMFEYGCGDARSTFDLGTNIIRCINYKDQKYREERGEFPPMIEVAKREIKLTTVLLDMKINGMKLWTDYTNKAIKHEEAISKKLHAEIRHLTNGINLNSGKQLAEYLKSKGAEVPYKKPTDNDLKMRDKWLQKRVDLESVLVNEVQTTTKRTPAFIKKISTINKKLKECTEKINGYEKGRPVTDKKTLSKLMEKYPDLDFLNKVTQAKEADKKLSTYYKNFLLLKDKNDIIHCGLNQEKPITGRLSSNEPNLQNLEKVYCKLNDGGYSVRKSFIARPDHYLFFFDYSQQEMIVMLDQSEEMKVIERLLSKEFDDFYLATAAVYKEFTGKELERQKAKAVALGLAYGQGIRLLAANLGITLDEAKEFKEEFFIALKKLKKLMKRLMNQIYWHGKIHSPFGRVTYIDKDFAYKSLNAFVQGTSADITKQALIDIYEFLKPHKSKAVLTVHDEICVEMHKDEFHLVDNIKQIMSNAYPAKHLKLAVDVEWAPLNNDGVSSWGEKEGYVG